MTEMDEGVKRVKAEQETIAGATIGMKVKAVFEFDNNFGDRVKMWQFVPITYEEGPSPGEPPECIFMILTIEPQAMFAHFLKAFYRDQRFIDKDGQDVLIVARQYGYVGA